MPAEARTAQEGASVIDARPNSPILGLPEGHVIGMDNFFGKDRKYTKFVVED